MRSHRETIIGQWQEHLNAMGNAIHDFEQALPDIETDVEFMAAYNTLARLCGGVLHGVQLPIGGTVDKLQAAVVGG